MSGSLTGSLNVGLGSFNTFGTPFGFDSKTPTSKLDRKFPCSHPFCGLCFTSRTKRKVVSQLGPQLHFWGFPLLF